MEGDIANMGQFIGAGLAAILIVELIASTRRNAARMETATRLRGIHQGYIQYAEANDGRLPPDLATLYRNSYFTADFVLSPLTNKCLPDGFGNWPVEKQDEWINTQSSYVLAPPWMRKENGIAVYLKPEDSDGHGIAIAWSDNHLTWVPIKTFRESVASYADRPLPQDAAKK